MLPQFGPVPRPDFYAPSSLINATIQSHLTQHGHCDRESRVGRRRPKLALAITTVPARPTNHCDRESWRGAAKGGDAGLTAPRATPQPNTTTAIAKAVWAGGHDVPQRPKNFSGCSLKTRRHAHPTQPAQVWSPVRLRHPCANSAAQPVCNPQPQAADGPLQVCHVDAPHRHIIRGLGLQRRRRRRRQRRHLLHHLRDKSANGDAFLRVGL